MKHKFTNFNKVLNHFGTKVLVWDISERPKSDDYFLGAPKENTTDWTSEIEPEERYEPVLPYSSSYQKLAFAGSVLQGGTEDMYNLSYYSTKEYGIGSIVQVPRQGTDKFKIISKANYGDFGVYIYQLKGDDQHPDG